MVVTASKTAANMASDIEDSEDRTLLHTVAHMVCAGNDSDGCSCDGVDLPYRHQSRMEVSITASSCQI